MPFAPTLSENVSISAPAVFMPAFPNKDVTKKLHAAPKK